MTHKSIALLLVLLVGQVAVAQQVRQRVSINNDWRFTRNDPEGAGDKLAYSNLKLWMLATGEDLVKDPAATRYTRPAGNIGQEIAYTTPAFNDSQWRKLNLPHDFGIEGPFDPNIPGGVGKLPSFGVAWYRKSLDIPANDQGKQIYLDIDGAMSYANIWLNGQYVGGWGYGYTSFRVDLTPHVKFGQPNVLAIRLDNPPASSRWYPGGGIYRNVWLVKTSPVHIAQWGTYITTPEVSPTSARVEITITAENHGSADNPFVDYSTEIFELDAQGIRIGRAVATFGPIGSGFPQANGVRQKTSQVKTHAMVSNPKLWSIKTPNRYVAVTTAVSNGRTVDVYETPFGIRTLKFDPKQGFFLNGELTELQGVCNHHDLGALGAAINTRALERQIEILKEMGCNAIRTSHNPPTPELLDLCDRMGMLVQVEAFDSWQRGKTTNSYHLLFPEWSEKDLRAMVRRDRNHPSIFTWSTGNEVGELGAQGGHVVSARLTGIIHDEDPTRPVSVGSNNYQAGFNDFVKTVDVFGFNYLRPQANNFGMYDAFRAANPDKFVYSSESASTISTRGFYTFPVTDNKAGGFAPAEQQMSSYDLYAPNWATPPDWEFRAQDQSPFSGGEFVWTGFDYLGEPTVTGGGGARGRGRGPATTQSTDTAPQAPPAPNTRRSSYFGIIDLAGFPKDRYYIYQARWRHDLPMAHILPHWNWAERVGEVTPVHVYSSGDEAELFLNGKSQGKKKREQFQYRFRWDDVKYEPGELKVVTWKAGKEWATKTTKTTGAAIQVALKADRATIAADGNDLSFVTVSIADKDGMMVPRSMNRVKFSITGPGEIVATDNGDASSMESFQQPERNAFNGLALVIVRSKPGQAGQITLRAESEGLTTAEIPITTK